MYPARWLMSPGVLTGEKYMSDAILVPMTARGDLPLDHIRRTLFQTRLNAAKIRRKYGIPDEIFGEELERRIFQLLGQQEQDPIQANWTNNEVFEKGVLTLGSNSRSWASFSQTLPQLRTRLNDFDAPRVAKWVDETGPDQCVDQLRPYLRGQTSGTDARAILALAQLLANNPAYYTKLRTAYGFFRDQLRGRIPGEPGPAVSICVALLLGNSRYHPLAAQFSVTKLPGMGVTLACEFLRNLGWTTFKPDRHVIEMIGLWYGVLEEQAVIDANIGEIRRIFRHISVSDERLLRTSLLGAQKTPPGTPINQADQLVWLYRSTLGKSGVIRTEQAD
jgi:hypothetical protein